MAVIKPWAMNALAGAPLYDAPTLRNINGAVLLGGQSAMLPLSGCLDPRALQVDVSSDPLVTVAAGPAVVSTAAGPYVTGLDSTWSGNLAARHASYARIDRVVLEVSDTVALREAQVRIIAGTPAPTPVAPAVPTTAIALGRVSVPSSAGGPASVVDERLFTAAQGGIIYVPDQAARLRLGNPSTGNTFYVHEMSTAALWRNSSDKWVRVLEDTGWLDVPPVGTATSTAKARRLNGVVYFAGEIRAQNDVAWPTGVATIGTVPSAVMTGTTTVDSARFLSGYTPAGIPAGIAAWINGLSIQVYYGGAPALALSRLQLTGFSGIAL